MTDWKVVLTPEFKQEIRCIHSYIANTLLVPETAINQVKRILDGIESLNNMPLRHTLYDKEPWRGRGLRKIAIDNYIVFYLPNEKTKEVVIFHVFYGGQNIADILGG